MNYHERPELSYSAAKHILRSPAHFQAERLKLVEPTMDMEMGTIIHAYVLEGKTPDKVISPPKSYPAPKTHQLVKSGDIKEGDPLDWNGNAKYCKDWIREKKREGYTVLSSSADERQCRIVESLQADDDVQNLLGLLPEREVELYGVFDGVPIRGKLDCLGFIGALNCWAIADLKKVPDASDDGFGKIAANRNLLLQAVWYCELVRQNRLGFGDKPTFTWIAAEDSEAAVVQCYEATETQLEFGMSQMKRVVSTYKQCTETGEWPAYGGGIKNLMLPSWALRQ